MKLHVRVGPLAVMLFALAALYLPWVWSDELADLGGDSAVYMMTARDFAPYLPADPVAHAIASESQFPPLYPALLAATGAAGDVRIAHLVTALSLVAAFAAYYAWLRSLELRRGIALALVASFAVLPGTFVVALQIKSEPLYLALSLAGLALLGRSVPRERASPNAWAAAAAIAAALMTRSAGAALLVGLGVALLRTRPPRAWLICAGVVAPAILWSLHRTTVDSYGGTLQAMTGAPLTAIAQQLALNGGAMVRGLALDVTPLPALSPLLAALLLVAVVVLARRALKLQADAWYAAAYFAMVLIWPYATEGPRLMWVIVPVLLGYAVLGGEQLAAAPSRARLRWIVPIAVAAFAVASFVSFVQRRAEAGASAQPERAQLPEWYGPDPVVSRRLATAHLEMSRALDALGRKIPAGECALSIKPATVAFYAHRDGFVPPFETVDAATFEQWMARSPCRYVLLLDATQPPPFNTPYYPRDRLGERLEVIAVETSGSNPRHPVVAALARLRR